MVFQKITIWPIRPTILRVNLWNLLKNMQCGIQLVQAMS